MKPCSIGVPTTRAFSLVTTGEQVMRDMLYNGNKQLEPGAVVVESHLVSSDWKFPNSCNDGRQRNVRVY